MTRTHALRGLIASTLAAVSMCAHAEPLFTSTLEDVLIGGTYYDVTFSQLITGYGSTRFNDVYGASGSPALAFTNSTDALAAADAVVAAAIALGVDVNPGSAIEGGFVLTYAYDATDFSFVRGFTTLGGYTTGPWVDFSRSTWVDVVSFADFTVSNIPEPSALGLLGLGLVGFAFTHRRKQ